MPQVKTTPHSFAQVGMAHAVGEFAGVALLLIDRLLR